MFTGVAYALMMSRENVCTFYIGNAEPWTYYKRLQGAILPFWVGKEKGVAKALRN